MERRLLTPAFSARSNRISLPVSVTALLIFFAVALGSSRRLTRPLALAADLLILAVGSWRS